MKKSARSVRIVLVRPRNPLNLLAAARAAANFGFIDLVVVAPHGPVWNEACESEQAERWLALARRTSTLQKAVGDCDWVLGTSCLARRRIEEKSIISLDQIRGALRQNARRNRIALVFGSEKRGLSKQDLDCCHSIVRIPTGYRVPSMNLGQAVAVCCYELRNIGGESMSGGRSASSKRPADIKQTIAAAREIDRLVESVSSLLAGESRKIEGANDRRQAYLRRMLMRWGPTSQEVSLLLGIFRDLAWKLQSGRSDRPASR